MDVSDMDLEDKINHIRSTLTPLDLADMLEFEVVRDKITSPFNEGERTPSCHLFLDGFYDFSTGKGGDVIDLYRAITGRSFGRAVNELLKGSIRMDADTDRVVRRPIELLDLTDELNKFGPPGPYLSGCWADKMPPITFDTLIHLSYCSAIFGGMNELAIPHWHDGKVRGIKLRSITGRKSAVPGSTFACGLYWPRAQAGTNTVAVITEGESDCWALLQAEVPADIFALPSGAGLWKDAWLSQLEQYETIFTAFDNDRAGKQATEKVRSAIGWGRWKELAVPTLFNDCREALSQGWQPKLA